MTGNDTPYLLAISGDRSMRIPLPHSGTFRLGRGPETHWQLDGEGNGGVLVRLSIRRGLADVARGEDAGELDLRVNGQPLLGRRPLISGDIVTVEETSLVFRGPSRPKTRPAMATFEQVHARLLEEAERCSRTGRPLAVVLIDFGVDPGADLESLAAVVSERIRLVDVLGWGREGDVLILMPDTGLNVTIPLARILDALAPLAPKSRAGVSLCPTDAADADSLLTGAWQAMLRAEPGSVALLGGRDHTVDAGGVPIVAVEPAMRQLLSLVQQVAPTGLPVLVVGDTGVGKEVVAQALHAWSGRTGPMVTINCAAIAESLFESELFGHVRGAFTGATEAKPGLLESAEGGTVFLDEIGECPAASQAKLLRVIETRRVCRVGALTERPVDIRIVAATNRNLEEEVTRRGFRRDLYYRLNTAVVVVPPLSSRPLDIPVLARAFLEEACARGRRRPMPIAPEAMRRLALHDWPGNVRELRNLMEFCAATVHADVLEAEALPPGIAGHSAPWLASPRTGSEPAVTSDGAPPVEPFGQRPFPRLRDELRHLERTRMIQALEATGGLQNKAAELLDMPLRTFVTRMREYDIPRERPASGRRRKR